jgi:hypothetical protein
MRQIFRTCCLSINRKAINDDAINTDRGKVFPINLEKTGTLRYFLEARNNYLERWMQLACRA